ncbi:MAG: hydrogenase maturation protease [Desulfobacterales bacterium]|nr:hydrogenase maturation protease [Desulfobacterales bacterium]
MIHIVCFGNLWAGDDGFGIHVFEELARLDPLPGVKIFDAGLLGLGALSCFEQCDKVIVVDALRGSGKVGVVLRLNAAEMALHYPVYSEHALGVNFLLRVLPIALAGQTLPEIVILAARIKEARPADNRLSGPVRAALPLVLALITEELLTC